MHAGVVDFWSEWTSDIIRGKHLDRAWIIILSMDRVGLWGAVCLNLDDDFQEGGSSKISIDAAR